MNWLGHLIQGYVSEKDTVLDLGCGIMQATTDVVESKRKPRRLPYKKEAPDILKCKSLLGCDIWLEYLKVANKYFPAIKMGMDELDRFVDNSFDIVICLDVIEHLPINTALRAIEHMKRIARHKVIIYTPSSFKTNEENKDNAWGMGKNPHQVHMCFIEPSKFEQLGFSISFPEPDKNTLAIFDKCA